MKRATIMVVLAVAMVTTSVLAFENPDGPTGTAAVTPFYAYTFNSSFSWTVETTTDISSSDVPGFNYEVHEYGVALRLPVSERFTLLADYTRQTFYRDYQDSQNIMILTDKIDNKVGVALRIYIGG